jgi:zinc transporter 9
MAGDSSSKGAVLAALICNTALTALKFTAFAFSGSGSMFSEAMHTLADTANQGLLFFGIKRSERAPDAMFSYGYGAERFFYSLLSAVGIFVLGCGVTVYHGVSTLIDPHELVIAWWLFLILGISFIMNGYVLFMAVRAVNKVRGDKSFLQFMRTTSDPTIAAVLLEDGIACFGVIVAVIGIGLSALTGSPVWDSLGSIVIGGLLGFVAIWLGYKNRSLLIGRSIPADVQEQVVAFLEAQPSVEKVRAVQSRVIGADQYKLNADIDWNGRWLGEQTAAWVAGHKPADGKEKEFACEHGERVVEALGDEIDRIETELKAKFPVLKYLDFEAD